MGTFGWSYPAGAANDPFAPYNEDYDDTICVYCGASLPDDITEFSELDESAADEGFCSDEHRQAFDKHGECLPNYGKPWVQYTKRTNEPKLAWMEAELKRRNIPSRRHGESWHAPILQVPEEHLEVAWAMLNEDVFGDGQRLDDIEDDDPVFSE